MKQFFMNLCKRINRFIKNNCMVASPIIINDSIKKVMFDDYDDSILTNEEINRNKEMNRDEKNHILNLPPYMRPKL